MQNHFTLTEFCLLDEQQGGFERERAEVPVHPYSVIFRDALFLHQLDSVDHGKGSGAESPIPSEASLSILKKGMLIML